MPLGIATATSGPGGGTQGDLPACYDGVLYVTLTPYDAAKGGSDVASTYCDHRYAKGSGGGDGSSGSQGPHSLDRAPAKDRRGAGRAVRREASTGALIGQDFDLTGYRTLLVQWTGTAYGCTTGSTYAIPNVGTSLNDRIESSKSFSGCTHDYHYQNSSYTGTVQPCGTLCSTLGTMNNQTTSIRWTR
jgi:hypothetical protein